MDMKSLIAKMDVLSQVDEAKPDFLDIDKDGDKKEPMKKAAKEKGSKKEDDKEKVEEAIAIQADGDEAMTLLDILKLSGQQPMGPQDATPCGGGMAVAVEADEDPTYTNSPDEEVADTSAATPSGTDMHRAKDSWRAAAGADNPMVAAMEGKLAKMFENMVSKNNDEDEWYDSKGRPSKRGAYDAGGHYHSEREDIEVKFNNKKK